MSRMLNALRQIDARQSPSPQEPDVPPPQLVDEPPCDVELQDVDELPESDEPVDDSQQEAPETSTAEPLPQEDAADDVVASDDAIEAALARAEVAAEMVADALSTETLPLEEPSAEELPDECVETPPPAASVSPAEELPVEEPSAEVIRTPQQAYGELAERILAQLPDDRSVALMFTSPQDGRETAASVVSLAGALAERIEGELALVDADVRTPKLAARMGVESSAGLADVLTGSRELPDAICETPMPRVHLLSGARFAMHDGRPPDMLNLKSLFADLLDAYRLVLVNTGPLTHREAAAIGRYCFGVYLVAPLGRTTRRALRQSVRAIQGCGGRMLGLVVRSGS